MFYDLARELRPVYPHLPLIGVGGIATAHDALEFIFAGASAIQIGTINLVNPRAGVEMLEELEAFLRAEGIADISALIGAALDTE